MELVKKMENEQYKSKGTERNYQIGNAQPNFRKKDLRISGTSEKVSAYMNALESQGIYFDEDEVRRILGD